MNWRDFEACMQLVAFDSKRNSVRKSRLSHIFKPAFQEVNPAHETFSFTRDIKKSSKTFPELDLALCTSVDRRSSHELLVLVFRCEAHNPDKYVMVMVHAADLERKISAIQNPIFVEYSELGSLERSGRDTYFLLRIQFFYR